MGYANPFLKTNFGVFFRSGEARLGARKRTESRCSHA